MKEAERITRYACCDGYEDIAIKDGKTIGDAVCQLADYENTGLSPQEVRAMQSELKSLKAVKKMYKTVDIKLGCV